MKHSQPLRMLHYGNGDERTGQLGGGDLTAANENCTLHIVFLKSNTVYAIFLN